MENFKFICLNNNKHFLNCIFSFKNHSNVLREILKFYLSCLLHQALPLTHLHIITIWDFYYMSLRFKIYLSTLFKCENWINYVILNLAPLRVAVRGEHGRKNKIVAHFHTQHHVGEKQNNFFCCFINYKNIHLTWHLNLHHSYAMRYEVTKK